MPKMNEMNEVPETPDGPNQLVFVLEVEPLNLGPDVKGVGLELVEVESREPAHGATASAIWAAALASIAGNEPYVLDFFAHLDRIREYCSRRGLRYLEKAGGRLVVIPALMGTELAELVERFGAETFGARAGVQAGSGDAAVEGELARRGVDGYHAAFANYEFCAVCDFQNGFLTVLSEKLWSSEVVRRIKPAVAELPVEVARPQ